MKTQLKTTLPSLLRTRYSNIMTLAICTMMGTRLASAQALDCAALANSADAEPAGYAERCVNAVAAPSSLTSLPPTRGAPVIAYTYDMRGQSPRPPGTLYTFPLSNFATQTTVGTTQLSIFAMDFTPNGQTLYAVTGSTAATNPSTLGTLNTTTGAFTVIAPLSGLTAGDSASGLTIDPVSGDAYFAAAGGATASSRLYRLNLTTGALTLIGQMAAPTDPVGTIMIDIAMNCNGQLFAHNISDDALYSINPASAAATLIGTHGLAANFAQGMDFDNASGTLYGFIYTGTGTNRFGTFDLATGAFTTLVQDNPLGEYEGAIPTQCGAAPDALFANGFEDPI